MQKRTQTILLVLFGLLWLGMPLLGQKTDDQRFVDGLRQRKLFKLAEQHVAQRLAEKEISTLDQGNLVIELIRTRMAAAIQADDATREESWNAAIAVGENFLKNRNHPRELVIRVQSELARLAHGKFLAQQLAAGIASDDLRNRAIQKISQARRGLEKVDREIVQAIPQAGTGPDDLTAKELRSLKKNVQYQLANCNLQAAKLFKAEEKGNRIDALMQVMERLQQVSSQTDSTMPLWWEIQIGRVEALRLQGKLDAAIEQLNKISTKELLTSDTRKSEMVRQQIELSLDLGRGDPVQLITAARAIKQSTPELDLSVVRLMMQTGTAARQTSERDKWQQAATVMTQSIEEKHGAYWGRLAELVVIGDNGTGGGGSNSTTTSTNLDILMRIGDEAWRKKNLEDAVKAFDRAYSQAVADGESSIAMTAGMKIGKIFQEQGNHKQAGQRLVQTAAEHARHENAPAAHLSGCWNLGRAAASEKDLIQQYAEQLASHVVQWPEASTVAQARIWLGRYQASKQQWQAAFETLIDVPEDSRLLIDASRLLPGVATAQLNQLKRDGQSTQEAASNFARRMSEKLTAAGAGSGHRWTAATRELLLGTCKFTLLQDSGEPEPLWALLREAQANTDDATPAWQQSAVAWSTVFKATKRETVLEAIESLEDLKSVGEPMLGECFDGLMKVQSTAPPEQLNEFKLKLIDTVLPRVATDKAVRLRWMSRKSTILVDAGRGQEAIEMLEQLIEASPFRSDLQIALAKALTDSGNQADAALLQWRKVAAGSKQYSSNWYQAKFYVAKLLSSSGKKDEAKKLLDYLKIPPGWDESEWKSDFDRLYSELGG
jgi:tetratricopeptide (TPR) repeat protein